MEVENCLSSNSPFICLFNELNISVLSLVRTPGDRRNLFALSGIRINQCLSIKKVLKGTEVMFVLTRVKCIYILSSY